MLNKYFFNFSTIVIFYTTVHIIDFMHSIDYLNSSLQKEWWKTMHFEGIVDSYSNIDADSLMSK